PAANDTYNKLKEKLGNLGGRGSEWGSSLMNGLRNGISGGAQAVKDAAGGVAHSLSSTFKNILGIHSPSRLFEQFGRFIDDGLIKGIEGGFGGIKSSMGELANLLVLDTPKLQLADLDY